jgi:DNA (cytosine-5)-methyltransferase 1
MTFTFAELFAGIGGFRQGLEPLGGNCVFASEIDKFATQAYKALYDGAPELHGDITQIDAKDVPDHDVLVGGFPCQAFSVAGKRLGFDDTRGTLFFEIARIMREKKPIIALLENVKGLVGHDKGKTLNTVVQTLSDIGYRVDFEVLNSKYFGVPQNRERIFIVAIREDLTTNEEWNVPKARNDVVAKGKRRIAKMDGIKTFNFDWPEQHEVTTRLRDVLEDNVDERYYLSEEKTANLVAQLEGERLKDVDEPEMLGLLEGIKGHEQRRRVYSTGGVCPTPSGLGVGGNTEPKIAEPQMVGHVDIKGHDAIKRVYSAEGVSPTVTTRGGGHREPKIAEERKGEIDIVGYTKEGGYKSNEQVHGVEGVSSTLCARDYKDPKRIAEEVRPVLTPDRIEKRQNGRRFKEDGEESFTCTAVDRHGVAVGEYPRYRIRKLTPLECWRLQGFPDAAHEAVKAAGISDSQRYKQAGNAVTVNVISALAGRILEIMTENKRNTDEN